MRIFSDPMEACREVERDLFEMGIDVTTQSMQDKVGEFPTKELQSYGFQISNWRWNSVVEDTVVKYLMTPPKAEMPAYGEAGQALRYIDAEFKDRVSGRAMNPGNSWITRESVWRQFMHDGKFAYTYSERIAPQLDRILEELRTRPSTRQAIINIHSNISPYIDIPSEVAVKHDYNVVGRSADLNNMGGHARIPCSLYYQVLRRNGAVDFVYAMRSCDFLTHFPIDLMIALRFQTWFADQLQDKVGRFTYFTGSLHAYTQDMKQRGIF